MRKRTKDVFLAVYFGWSKLYLYATRLKLTTGEEVYSKIQSI